MKAVAIHTIFIVITTVIFFFFAVIIIFGFVNLTGLEASSASCTVKMINYCSSWAAKGFADEKPYDWATKDPTGCSTFVKANDATGPTEEECEAVVN